MASMARSVECLIQNILDTVQVVNSYGVSIIIKRARILGPSAEPVKKCHLKMFHPH